MRMRSWEGQVGQQAADPLSRKASSVCRATSSILGTPTPGASGEAVAAGEAGVEQDRRVEFLAERVDGMAATVSLMDKKLDALIQRMGSLLSSAGTARVHVGGK
eukprot:CAMPEP_0114165284 /NCGR_PEP_ID=MMETSP0043_2-20121206/31164_1 /TAXON_ID=464988 /ORGANISM="Hemiselmis andersenii, Strain CCMP644" /LENGTH=103 /DNA_ID=CAMNT_0001262091 /DNA_START=24 /DNA_END=335 /DNA_ORIENTATION=+